MNTLFSSSSVVSEATLAYDASREKRGFFTLSVLLVVTSLTWQAVTIALTGGAPYWTSSTETMVHMAVNWACLGAALAYAVRRRGQLDIKIAQALLGAGVIFGIYALLILGGRLFFSRPLLVSTASEAALLSLAVVLGRHKLAPTRVAIIAPLTQWASPAMPAAVITHPETDLRPFDILLVSLTGPVTSDWSRALARAMLCGCRIRHVGEYLEELRGAVSLEHFEHDHVTVQAVASYRPIKRLVDILLVILLLPLALPALLIGMTAVAIGSGFPVFFVQERVGLGGKTFRMWKLRSMGVDACADDVRAAVPGDRRVTGVGRVIRRLRVDELPQLWNVLRGDMSLIGPRPEAVRLHDQYQSELPNYAYRHLVRPGITGWAQVNTGPSANTEEARRKLTFDLFYVKKVSLYLDMQILLRTFWIVTSGGGVR